jgi:hypothetical protein
VYDFDLAQLSSNNHIGDRGKRTAVTNPLKRKNFENVMVGNRSMNFISFIEAEY